MQTVSSLAEGFRSSVAPPWARRVEGGSATHRSSQISTPIVNNGSLTQRKSRPVENSTLSCPAKGMQKSVPRSSRPEVNQRPS